MRRALLAVAVLALLLVPQAVGRPAVAKLLLGVSGDPARFQGQTGQASAVRSFFLGWQQGQTWGTTFPKMLGRMGPIPMFHIGTRGRSKAEAITPREVASGKGDSFLVALNQGVAEYGALVYARFLAEGNHCARNYAAFECDGSSRGPKYSPDAQADAFARFSAILRGGARAEINSKLPAEGPPALQRPRSAGEPAEPAAADLEPARRCPPVDRRQ